MARVVSRLFQPSLLPGELWADDLQFLPRTLVRVYRRELEERGLLDRAINYTGHGSYGGATSSESAEHFAGRFTNSCGRIQHLLLDPKHKLPAVHSALHAVFSSGHVALLDAPCGAGAASIAILSTLMCLRASRVLPKLPLTISITGGDISEESRDQFEKMFGRLSEPSREVGIQTELSLSNWDAHSLQSTGSLVETWINTGRGNTEFLVIVPHFSGEGGESGFFKKMSPSLQYITTATESRCSPNYMLLFVEPANFNRAGAFFKTLGELVDQTMQWFTSRESAESTFELCNPLKSDSRIPTGVQVRQFRKS